MLEKYYRINQAAGISVDIRQDGSLAISLCIVHAEGNQLDLEKKITGISSVNELKTHLPAKFSVALNLSGKGILYKQTEKIEDIDQLSFSKILPNARFDDFYIQNFISGEFSFVSVIRKTDADKWIGQFAQLGIQLQKLSLGPFVIANIADQLNIYEGDIVIDGHYIRRNEKKLWIDYRYDQSSDDQFPIKLASETIDKKLVIPYAAAFQLILCSQIDPVGIEVPSLETTLNQKLDENKLKVRGFIILAVFFLLLLINYVILSWLGAANSRLDSQVSMNDQNTDSLNKIEESVKKKEASLDTLGWEGGLNKSILIDQVASLIPAEITLSEISVNPLDHANSRAQKSIAFLKRRIRIAGNSDQIIPVNEWIARIKTRKWVKGISLDSYNFDSEHNTGRFLISIDY